MGSAYSQNNIWDTVKESRWEKSATKILGEAPKEFSLESIESAENRVSNSENISSIQPAQVNERLGSLKYATLENIDNVYPIRNTTTQWAPNAPKEEPKKKPGILSRLVKGVTALFKSEPKAPPITKTVPSGLNRVNAIVTHYRSGKEEFALGLVRLQKQHSKDKAVLNREEKALLEQPEHRFLKEHFEQITQKAFKSEQPNTKPSSNAENAKKVEEKTVSSDTFTDADWRNSVSGIGFPSEPTAPTKVAQKRTPSSKSSTSNPKSRIESITSIYQSGDKEFAYKLIKLGQERNNKQQILSKEEKATLNKAENRHLKQQFLEVVKSGFVAPDVQRIQDTIKAYRNNDLATAHRLSEKFPEYAMGYLKQNPDQRRSFIEARKAANTWAASKLAV